MSPTFDSMNGTKVEAATDRHMASHDVSPSSHEAASRTNKETHLFTPFPDKENNVYIPPAIRRLRALSNNDSESTTGDAEQPKQARTVTMGAAQGMPNGDVEQRQHLTDDETFFKTFFEEHEISIQFVRSHFPDFCELTNLRLKGWNHPDGEEYFKKQRYHTDNADRDTSQKFLKMMNNVAWKMQQATGVFTLPGHRPTVLSFAFAPGGFIGRVLQSNHNVQVTGITLSAENAGIPVLVKDRRLETIYADIPLMAGDMGLVAADIPPDHPDATNFIREKKIRPRAQFDLVTSEGGVLRPHLASVGTHRERREAHRLKASQLALALSRVKTGGSMIVLMHKAEAWNTLCLLYIFSKFSKIRLFKPDQEHQYKSSFYMIATDIKSQSKEARAAVEEWKREWKAATFGTDEQYQEEVRKNALDVNQVLEEFGDEWIELSKDVWNKQLEGLRAKSFTQ